MTSESLCSSSCANIPEFRRGIASTGNENIAIARSKGQAKVEINISNMNGKTETNYLITSPVWSLNSMTRTPASISQSMHVISPELVTI